METLKLYEAPPPARIELEGEGLTLDKSCTRCGLHQRCFSVCIPPRGKPGGILLVGEHPGLTEDQEGKPFVGKTGNLLEEIVERTLGPDAPVVYDNAVRCYPGKEKIDDKHIAACRPYLARVMVRARPQRIVAMGSKALAAVLGRSPAVTAVRKGYARTSEGVPVMFSIHPAAALYNDTVAEWLEEDLVWALTAEPTFPSPWGSVAYVVQTPAEAAQAVADLRASPWFAFDVEAFGRMFTDSYRVTRFAGVPRGKDHAWVWDYNALRTSALVEPLRELMRDPAALKTAHNGKYDLLACRLDKALAIEVRGFHLDTMIARSMLDTNTSKHKKLDVANELVGMGGHKEEKDACVDQAEKLLGVIRTRRKNAREIKRKQVEREEKAIRTKYEKARAKEAKKKQPSLEKIREFAPDAEERAVSEMRRRVMEEPDDKITAAMRELLELYSIVPEDIELERDEALAELKRIHEEDVKIACDGIDSGDEPEKYTYLWIPKNVLGRYVARDTLATAKLGELVEVDFQKHRGVHRVWKTVVKPALEAAVQVEQWGVPVDKDAIVAFRDYTQVELAKAETELKSYGDINWGSPDQLAEVLYEQLKLPILARTDTKRPSTDKGVLKQLERETKHPILPLIFRYRRMQKMLSQYIAGMLAHVTSDGKIHPWLEIDGADTGRLSCKQPNLQNIPRAGTPEGKMARDMFCAWKGWTLVQLDYSQIELRVAAALSRDPKMIKIFQDGDDYHMRTAEMIAETAWGLTPEKWAALDEKTRKEYRAKSKEINFGLLYGMDDFTLATRLGCSEDEAAKLRAAILGEFHYLAAWIEQEKQLAIETGYAFTYWWYPGMKDPVRARQRSMPDVRDRDRKARNHALRAVTNNPVQGTAGDLCTHSLALSVGWILADCFPGQLVLPVHDSLMFHTPEGTEEELIYNVKKMMEERELNGVPVVVDVERGPRWGSLEKAA